MIQVGDTLEPLTLHITRGGVVRYAGAATDFNPIHYSDDAASAAGLPGVVAHGMWTMGAALRIVTDWVEDPARVIDYFVRFTAPVVVGEGAYVEVTATVSAIEDGVATVVIDARCGEQKVLGAAQAKVRIA